jgi:predicted nucleotide-binding protein
MAKKQNTEGGSQEKLRTYVSQADIPAVSLEKAIKIPSAIGENYGYKPATALQVAKALDVQPTTGYFKRLTGAAIAYGLTTGGYNADMIAITPLGLRIVRPTSEGDDLAAKREAVLKPRVTREFLQKYDGAPIPKDSIAQNVLMEMKVPQERTGEVLKLILESAGAVGFLQTIKDRLYVDLRNTQVLAGSDEVQTEGENVGSEEDDSVKSVSLAPITPKPSLAAPFIVDARARRVFITHGKNQAIIEPIKKLLIFGELEAVVAIQTQTVSQPVPAKVMEGMRSCGAAIIHVEGERHLVDNDGNQHVILNDNVLIEIGAAMALYGQRFILVVRDGVKLPSNLQGLLELRYKGDTLDMEETVKLLEAINDMKQRPLPQPTSAEANKR